MIGSIIGSGIFIVSAEMGRQIGHPRRLLAAWVLTGRTVTGALSYGELASMMPGAGGQYVYRREAFRPLWVILFLYRPSSTWPGLVIVLLGLPVYWLFRRAAAR